MLRSLVGSEMCIRDSTISDSMPLASGTLPHPNTTGTIPTTHPSHPSLLSLLNLSDVRYYYCLLYTSDAADEEDSVDLGGRRIIKKKKSTWRMYNWSDVSHT
eukprot:TRINITY_DN5185_c0_g1_i3.p1 TRINITY_DN5185_c0_g1~~TRINITY_DN5185_c0_g1_i3.p1  ORF type:complete len:102 (+),score=26.61 TRINITY_DN5185_c0_g1_i3:172-477(+)